MQNDLARSLAAKVGKLLMGGAFLLMAGIIVHMVGHRDTRHPPADGSQLSSEPR